MPVFGPAFAVAKLVGVGTAVANGDFTASGGWGNTATVTAAAGTDNAHSFLVTCQGTGIAANPTITYTFKAAYASTPRMVALCNYGTGSGTVVTMFLNQSASGYTLTYLGTPITATTYGITVFVMQ